MPPQRNIPRRGIHPLHPYKRSGAHSFGTPTYYDDSTGNSHPVGNFLKSDTAHAFARGFDLAWQNLTQASYSGAFNPLLLWGA